MFDPLVSVRLMTYNHSEFIDDAMKGILLQKTLFPFEVIIGDDFSSDNTLDLIRKYNSTEKIKINILPRSIGDEYFFERQKTGRLYNFMNILQNCKGKYIALLDGDDYWTDPLKLQKQVELLEENTQYSACFTNGLVIDEIKNEKYIYKHYIKKVYEVKDIILGSGSLFPTASMVFRNNLIDIPKFFLKARSGDRALALLLGNLGPFYLIDEMTCIYRRHNKGIFSSIVKNTEERIEIDISNIELLRNFNDYTKKRHDKQVKKAISKRALISLLRDKTSILKREKLYLIKYLAISDWIRLFKNILK